MHIVGGKEITETELTDSFADKRGDDGDVQLVAGLVPPDLTVVVKVLVVEVLEFLVVGERYFRVFGEHETNLG